MNSLHASALASVTTRWEERGFITFCRVHLCFVDIKSFNATQLKCLEVKLTTVESWVDIIWISGILTSSFLMFEAAVRSFLALFKNPFLPNFITAAQVPAITAPDLDPAIVGVTYIPPDQVVTGLRVNFLNSFVLNIKTEKPLGP